MDHASVPFPAVIGRGTTRLDVAGMMVTEVESPPRTALSHILPAVPQTNVYLAELLAAPLLEYAVTVPGDDDITQSVGPGAVLEATMSFEEGAPVIAAFIVNGALEPSAGVGLFPLDMLEQPVTTKSIILSSGDQFIGYLHEATYVTKWDKNFDKQGQLLGGAGDPAMYGSHFPWLVTVEYGWGSFTGALQLTNDEEPFVIQPAQPAFPPVSRN